MKNLFMVLALLVTALTSHASTNNLVQTNAISLKPTQQWTWQSIANIPKVKWDNKTPKTTITPSIYSIIGNINRYSVLEAHGTQTQPKVIIIRSSQTYKESEDGAATYKLIDLFNKSELKAVKSNCTKKQDHVNIGEYQYFYQWQKPGFKPLYVYEGKFVSGTYGGGIIKEYAIVQDFNNFNLLADAATGSILDNYLGHDDKAVCRLQ